MTDNSEKKKSSYSEAGVNLEAADSVKKSIKEMVKSTFTPGVLTDIGLFGGLFAFDREKYKNPVLVSSTDGVGTKLKLAFITGRHDTIGRCLVNHCVNDILAQGAVPLFFLDYIASGKLNPETVSMIIKGLAVACKENGCALIGGETAEMPGFYRENEYDLAGFIIGVVEREKLIDGSRIRDKDLLIGLKSNGLHTNGYSLARMVFFNKLRHNVDDYIDELGSTVGDELLKIHCSYLKPVSRLMERIDIAGIAHITGGGFEGNISRILQGKFDSLIDTKSWDVPPLFKYIEEKGKIDKKEMCRVFNMGIGLVIIIKPDDLEETRKILSETEESFTIIGSIIKGSGEVRLDGI